MLKMPYTLQSSYDASHTRGGRHTSHDMHTRLCAFHVQKWCFNIVPYYAMLLNGPRILIAGLLLAHHVTSVVESKRIHGTPMRCCCCTKTQRNDSTYFSATKVKGLVASAEKSIEDVNVQDLNLFEKPFRSRWINKTSVVTEYHVDLTLGLQNCIPSFRTP